MQRQVYKRWLQVGQCRLELGDRPLLMGIVNATPDSFSDGGQFFEPAAAIERACQLAEEGADWIDIGGESTRPGAEPVSEEEELRRVLPVIEAAAGRLQTPISIDTYKPEVARRAIDAGATILNDVTGFRDPRMIEVAAGSTAACICMHMRGTPSDMQQHAEYDDVVAELVRYFEERLEKFRRAGVDPERVVLDPGLGFAKRRHHNREILRRITDLHALGRPLLVGASRKSFLGEITGRSANDRLYGTIATSILACLDGVQVLRVHDVAANRDALRVLLAIESEASLSET